MMITDEIQLRPRYGEVDQMGYVYHANYVSYCHQARSELLRKMGISTVVFVDSKNWYPMGVPDFVEEALNIHLNEKTTCN